MAAVGGATIGNTINGLKDAIKKTSSFNTSAQLGDINTVMTNITDSINKFKNSEILDVDQNSISALISIASSQNFGACAALSTSSWVPSMVNTSVVGCSISGGTTYNNGNCPQGTLEAAGGGCNGCMDTSLFMNNYYSGLTQGQWKAKLDAIYGTSCTSAWNTYFGNVWDNYYQIKVSSFAGISSRWGQVNTDFTAVNTNLNNINITMSNVINVLTLSFDSIVDPTYGLIAGLNCRIIG
jgi:hypothetical protein